ncbi:hypothetical protein [Streptomyces viridochromogenes]|uniref:hypothetical protein n=1 Tax=Streptomyces viridochromogenes TaxID=1938 RepID=UPI000A6E7A2C|nr:hypothetical protein [Streptomyces viridochromogenes]
MTEVAIRLSTTLLLPGIGTMHDRRRAHSLGRSPCKPWRALPSHPGVHAFLATLRWT